jgi:hypothetical protein
LVVVETTLKSELESLSRSYARLSHDVGGRINFACDVDNDDAFKMAEREKVHLDHAFFVLSFAALEHQITLLACAREADVNRKTAMRDAKFKDRWQAAAKVAGETLGRPCPWEAARQVVLSWYDIRSDIAHGRSPSQFVDVPPILGQAREIATTLDQVINTKSR